ncbi:hypothetical protein F4809DRAFT_614322 [Biscogniauxia mediterranea]|nr:hypothetical protein F4809DRAFT_614322 [Biscogniauxia mediterranea]
MMCGRIAQLHALEHVCTLLVVCMCLRTYVHSTYIHTCVGGYSAHATIIAASQNPPSKSTAPLSMLSATEGGHWRPLGSPRLPTISLILPPFL